MNILVFSHYYYPELFRINELCEELARRGHEVTVVTGYPNYPLGKTYEGYGLFKKYEKRHNGVNIKRIPVVSRGKGSLHMFMNMVSYIVSGGIWSAFNFKHYDVAYIFEVSPVTVALPAVVLKKLHKTPVIMNVQDLWPENVEVVLGITNKAILNIISKTVDHIYRNCNYILASSKSFVENIVDRGHDRAKVKFWPQFCEEPAVSRKNAKKPSEYSDRFKIVFTGNIGYAQGLHTAIEAAKLLKNEPIDWYFVGDGRARAELEERAKASGLKNVHFTGKKKPEEVPAYLYHADCALIILDDNKVFNMTIPAKLQTYLSCGAPVVASANGELADIIKDADCGISCEAGSAEKLAEAVRKIYMMSDNDIDVLSRNARSYYENNYTEDKLVSELENYINILQDKNPK